MSLDQKVADQIAEWTDDEIMFTAFDVTVALRNAGEHIAHNDVRKIVHQMYKNQDFNTAYQQSSVTVPGTSVSALLFHHLNSDIDLYEPITPTYSSTPQASKTPTMSMALGIRSGIRNKQPVNGVLSCAYPKSDGSLTIPSKLLDSADLKGKSVALIDDGSVIKISTSINASSHATIKSPKSDGELLIPRKILKSLSKNTYTIEMSSDGKEIHVR